MIPQNIRLLQENVEDSDQARPWIFTNDRQLRDLSTEALDALHQANDPPFLFQRGGRLVHIRRDEKDLAYIEETASPQLKSYLTRVADFFRASQGGGITALSPPENLVKDILAQPSWPFPPLYGISGIPLILLDGSIVMKEGYDRRSGFSLEPAKDLVIPAFSERPLGPDVARATGLLNEVIEDFPFDSEASRANALALILTPVLRTAFEGLVPLAVIDAPRAGTGKSLLADVVSLISTGSDAPRMSPPNDDEEWRRVITAKLRSGPQLILLDNLSTTLSSGTLANALTSQTWEDRQLRTSEILRLPNRATWMVTGNNVRLGGDIARRCFHIRQDARKERPWEGRSFRHPDLRSWIIEHRGELIAACLTLAKAWFDRGCPEADVPRIGTFEPWCSILGGVLASAGVKGFLENLQNMYEAADDDAERWIAFFTNWFNRFGEQFVRTAHIIDWLQHQKVLLPDLPEAIGDLSGDGRKVGRALSEKSGAIYGELRLTQLQDKHLKVALWRVERM